MKRTNIILVFLSILIGALVSTSCSKDHDIPTGKVFNADSGGGSAVDSLTISVSAHPSEGGTVTGGGKYQKGKTCVVAASANEGYVFSNWTENGTQVSTSESYSFTVDADRTLVANFVELQPNQYVIQVVIDPSAGGTATISGGGTTGSYTYNQQCTVVATLATGYHFLGWYKNGSQVSQELSYTFPVVDSCTLEARFEINTYTITVNASPANGGTVQINNGTAGGTASGTFAHGTTIQLKATANSGYDFSQWSDGGAQTHYVTVTAGETYTATFSAKPQAPTGAIGGKFTINANGDKVYFSQGNLQYIGSASAPYWKFADNQWDVLGTTTGQNSTNQNVDRDLFGWGTSGYHNASDPYNVNYQPWSTSTSTVNGTYNDSGYGPSTNMPSPNLTGSSANYDWGVYNAISNGGGQAGQWRTLTREEWVWVLGPTDSPSPGVNCRTSSTVNGTPNARYAKGQVAGVHGVIVFPDSYTHPSGVAQPVGINETGNTGWNGNDYSSTDFGRMEANGAVFLPSAGYRCGDTVNVVGSGGLYWSASCDNSFNARGVGFYGTSLYTDFNSYRSNGRGVRLACPAEN